MAIDLDSPMTSLGGAPELVAAGHGDVGSRRR